MHGQRLQTIAKYIESSFRCSTPPWRSQEQYPYNNQGIIVSRVFTVNLEVHVATQTYGVASVGSTTEEKYLFQNFRICWNQNYFTRMLKVKQYYIVHIYNNEPTASLFNQFFFTFRCLNERTSAALQELGHLLVNFWSEAKLPCPHLPFTECDLRQYVENISNMPFLEGALQELENLIQHLQIVLADP